ncbi:xanthine dehydrogenase small subunit [Dongia mobilis]|uniref:xanthine dehydrogenase small subunit n=1 Tax=Dongia sp. TaxID=1977262 RepID=UPI0026ECCB97
MAIRYLLGHDMRSVEPASPTETVLDHLRRVQHRPGTKEGCAEGDCGACTVVIGDLQDCALRYRAVNACIQFVGTLQGKQLITVEDLPSADGSLHPVQQAMVDAHGSQCGFCTPGIVMSLFAQYRNASMYDAQSIRDALAGNLCRCTGYGPILSAAEIALKDRLPDQFDIRAGETIAQLQALADEAADTPGYFAPRSGDELAALYRAHPTATLVAGGTDVGLWVTKQHRQLDPVISLAEVADLQTIHETASEIVIGAGVTYAQLLPVVAPHWPDFAEIIRRLGSAQIRNVATLGGNIANGSPIGDGAPCLIALGATLMLRQGDASREMPLQDFFLAYGKQDRRPGEFVEAIRLPKPQAGWVFRAYKISKRFDQDISALLGAFHIKLEDGRVADSRIVFGGMAAVPKRALMVEAALRGQFWNAATIDTAATFLAQDYQPIGDMRASAGYRGKVAANLLRKCFIELSDPAAETRVALAGRRSHG